jgi:CDI toxin RNase A-like protein
MNASNRRSAIASIALLLAFVTTSCGRSAPANHVKDAASTPVAAAEHDRSPRSSPDRDLSADEAMGGHTLARHVGKTNAQLIDRLRREPQISSASTYTDRATAEHVVGAALASGGRSFDAWRTRAGPRPNLVLRYGATDTIGRSISRGRSASVPCNHALVVLRWDDRRQRFYVLTSYPEAGR